MDQRAKGLFFIESLIHFMQLWLLEGGGRGLSSLLRYFKTPATFTKVTGKSVNEVDYLLNRTEPFRKNAVL